MNAPTDPMERCCIAIMDAITKSEADARIGINSLATIMAEMCVAIGLTREDAKAILDAHYARSARDWKRITENP